MNGITLATTAGFQLVPFKDLSKPYQLALIQYMAADGAAWDCSDTMMLVPCGDEKRMKAAMEASLPYFVEGYGDVVFGVSSIDSSAIQAALVERGIFPNCKDWESYSNEAMSAGFTAIHSEHDRWPAILCTEDLFQDGWTRAHAYLAAQHADIPVVFFPPPAKPSIF